MKSNVRFCLAGFSAPILSLVCVFFAACASRPHSVGSPQGPSSSISCDRESGKLIGLRGAPYPAACPLDMESEFSRGYTKGREQSEFRVDWREVRAPERDEQFRVFRTGYLESQKGSCTQNSDCRIESRCHQGSCEGSGSKCVSDRACVIEGQCIVDHCQAR